MPTPVIESSEGGQHVEWSETFHAFMFRAGIYLKRFWWILIITVAAGVALQKWKLQGIKPYYVSTAEMMPGGQAFAQVGTSGGYSEIVSNYFGQQIHILMSPQLKKTAMENVIAANSPTYEKDPPWVNATADLIPNSNFLLLQATGGDPVFTKLFLEAWMEAFLHKLRDMRDIRMQDYDLSLTAMAKKYETEEMNLSSKLSEYLRTMGIASVEEAGVAAEDAGKNVRNISAMVENYQKQLIPLVAALPTPTVTIKPPAENPPAANLKSDPARDADAIASQYPMDTVKFNNYIGQAGDVLGQNTAVIDREIQSHGLLPMDPDYEINKDRRAHLQAKYDELKGGLGENHPKMEDLKRQIDSIDIYLQVLRRTRVITLQQVRTSILSELGQMIETEKEYQKKNNDYLEIMKTINDFKSQIKNDDDRYLALLQGSKSLQEGKDLGQEMLLIYQHASDPDPNGVMPDQAKMIGQSAFVGLASGIVIIFLLGMLDGRVLSVEDLTQRFDQPMLGVIPMQKRLNGQVELLKHNDKRQMFAESCRNIRSSLLYMDRQGQRPRVIMLTSSMPSEGKSTLSSNLAITLGFAASRTLLVDADMRRGQLHKRFGLKNDVGLAEHIEKGLPLEQVIQPTTSENLDLISCGKYPVQPGELLMSDRFRDTIQTLRGRYDFVVFDSPPILLTDDAASFATRADAVIFVVRAGYTRLRQVRASLENLARRGVNVYGMVVNFIDHREPGYYTYRYYDYYSYRADTPDKKGRRDKEERSA